ncbi:MAG: hypothetical protein DRI65_13810, partial [Chloroflexota bacterium]
MSWAPPWPPVRLSPGPCKRLRASTYDWSRDASCQRHSFGSTLRPTGEGRGRGPIGEYAVTHRLHRRAGPPHPQTGRVHDISADDAGWKYVGFSDFRLAPGQSLTRPADDHELAVVVLEGSASIRAGGQRYSSLGSRETVFDGPPPPVLLL